MAFRYVVLKHRFHQTSNADGMWNLNEIAKALNVDEPGQWRTAVRRELDRNANLHLAHGGSNPGTYATEAGTIAYAMWVSTEFYLMVIHAFVAMRNSAIRDAKAKDAVLAANMRAPYRVLTVFMAVTR